MRKLFLLFIGLLFSSTALALPSVLLLTNAMDTVDRSSYTTASITPHPNSIILIGIESRIASGVAGGPNVPTVSGCSLTWVQVVTKPTAGATPNRALTVLRAMGSPTSGTLTISFNSQIQTHASWYVVEISDVDISGTNGSGAIVQSGSANDGGSLGTTATVSLSAFSNANNLAVGFALNTGGASPITVGSGFTQIGTENNEVENGTDSIGEYKINSSTVNCSWTGSNSWVICAAEVKAYVGSHFFVASK